MIICIWFIKPIKIYGQNRDSKIQKLYATKKGHKYMVAEFDTYYIIQTLTELKELPRNKNLNDTLYKNQTNILISSKFKLMKIENNLYARSLIFDKKENLKKQKLFPLKLNDDNLNKFYFHFNRTHFAKCYDELRNNIYAVTNDYSIFYNEIQSIKYSINPLEFNKKIDSIISKYNIHTLK